MSRFLRAWLAQSMCVVGLICAGLPAGRSEPGPAPVDVIRFSLDHPVDALAAPFVLAAREGYFRAAGLAVTTGIADGSRDAIARVAAGTSDLAVADINALIRFRDTADAPAVKAVFVLFNAAPYAVIARRSRGIRAPVDLDGKSLGVIEGDPAILFWPALVRRSGINPATVRQQTISAAVREPMLSAGQLDAVIGRSSLAAVNLRDRGVPADDLAVLRFADYGCEAYGMAVIVNPKFAAARPEAVRAFLRATVAGLRLTVSRPGDAVEAVLNQMDSGSPELEQARLQAAIRDNILTAEVLRDGFGGIDKERLDRAIGQIAIGYGFRKRPQPADIFDGSFLPPPGQRRADRADDPGRSVR